jgi:AcrR family transcriptional regulator
MSKRSDATRERLFEAAVDLIGERGYQGTTVDDIVARAGVAKGTVYYHFAGKTELVQALLTDGLDKLSEAFRAEVEANEDPREALHCIVFAELRFIHDYQAFSKLLMSELWRADRVWREALVMLRDKYICCVQDVLARGVASGQFRADLDPQRTSSIVFGTIATSALDWLVFDPERGLEDVSDETTRYVMGAVEADRDEG